MIDLRFRRPDGTFVAHINGAPYHVIEGDEPLWSEAVDRAGDMGDDLGFEPDPEPPPLTETPPAPTLSAMVELTIVDGEIYGVEQATGIGFAMMLEPGIFWVFFSEPQADAAYIPFVQSPGHNVDVTGRELDHIEIAVTDRATADLVTPANIAITVQRVK